MHKRRHLMVRVVALTLMAASVGVLSSPGTAEASSSCSGWHNLGCRLGSTCDADFAELWCNDFGGPSCHTNGDDCILWPWNNCEWGFVEMSVSCYG